VGGNHIEFSAFRLRICWHSLKTWYFVCK